MTQLKYNEKTYREVDYNDLDNFISEVFGIKYECVAYEEWGNYQSHSFDVTPEELDDHYKEELKEGDFHYMLGCLLNDACHQGLLQPGDYLINVFW